MRLFVSIDFPESILKTIQSWIPEQAGWKKTSLHQMHLTLVFLGDCSAQEKDEIHKILSEIEFTPFDMVIEGLGAFPNESAPRIIWAGVQHCEELINLQQSISDSLKDYIKSKHSDSYIPHITLARKKSNKGINYDLKQMLRKETEKLVVEVESFQLKQSILKSSGSEHIVLLSYS
ncbi:MAG: RNA 2',3'-cyclic phosphodiesterase [Balneolaceae bacterium]|nr:RNA 2',3'-cyclic phosphodiesterase [Balneolaceae bacterium]